MDTSGCAGGLGIELLSMSQSNYKVWRSCMESYLVGEDLWDVVDGNEVRRPAATAESSDALKKWKRLNAKAEFALKRSISHNLFDRIRGCNSAHRIWKTLERLFTKRDEAATAPLQRLEKELGDATQDELDRLRRYRPLYRAALEGDWEAAQSIFKSDPDALSARITPKGETALLVAADVGQVRFIEKLVELMPEEALEIKEHWEQRTALHHAAIDGRLSIVKTLDSRNGKLMRIPNKSKYMPLHSAAYYLPSKDVVGYLVSKIPDEESPTDSPFFAGNSGGQLISKLVDSRFYDICLHLLEKYPFLATASTYYKNGLLPSLAYRASDFRSGSKLGFWSLCIYQLIPVEVETHHKQRHPFSRGDLEDSRAQAPPPTPLQTATSHLIQVMRWINSASWTAIEYLVPPAIKHIKDEKYRHKCTQKMVEIACQRISDWNEKEIMSFFSGEPHILHVAAQTGAVELITTCLRYFPYLIADGETMLQHAVLNRQEKVFNLFLQGTATTKYLASAYNKDTGDCILHLAARLAPYPQLTSVSCPALQMQRELQWFKAAKELVNPFQRGCRNKKQETADEIFTTEHKGLIKDAEAWMKDTSNSCMVVATLIATVAFAAAFTVPGGNVEGKGIPLFLGDKVFILFAASDSLALFSSSTSILMFLFILTARYAKEDFLRELPEKLILGFASLFLAIATMMVAFGATMYMALKARFKWISIPIIIVTLIPGALFVKLQLPLFVYMVRSTYFSRIFRPTRIW